MKSVKFILSCLILSCACNNVSPMSDEAANITATAVGISTGVISYALLSQGGGLGSWNLPVAALAGCGSGLICKAILNNFTPDGRFQRAESKINRVETDFICSKSFLLDSELISFVRKSYISSNWPLAIAIEHLDYLRYDLISASSLLHAVLSEATNRYDLSPKCVIYIEKSNLLLKKIVDFMEIIKKDPIYNVEFDRYQRDKLVREQMAQQQRLMAQQQRLHNEDWLQRERLHREKMKQREKIRDNSVTVVLGI